MIAVDWDKVIPNHSLSLAQGAIRPWSGKTSEWERNMLHRYAKAMGIPLDQPWSSLRPDQREMVLEGEGDYHGGRSYPGVRAWFRWMESRTYKMHVRVLLSRYRAYSLCEKCQGARLNEQALAYRVGDYVFMVADPDTPPPTGSWALLWWPDPDVIARNQPWAPVVGSNLIVIVFENGSVQVVNRPVLAGMVPLENDLRRRHGVTR